MAQLDYETAQDVLDRTFRETEEQIQSGADLQLSNIMQPHLDTLFNSNTQAYREVLLGCILVRLQDKAVDIHLPYVNQGPTAYNARDLDEVVVNPFLKIRQVPSSKEPFLNVFRRGVRVESSTRQGLR